MFKKIKKRIDKIIRKYRLKNNKNFRLTTKKSVSIIASNCNGGVLCKDLGIPFNSPFVNLWIEPKDYLKLLKQIKFYMEYELSFIKVDNIDYPVGILCDIKLYFMHYFTEKEAMEAWNRRKRRINYENIVVMFTDRDGCTYDDLKEFDKLPYKKVVFTANEYKDIQSSFFIRQFKSKKEVGILTDFIPQKLGIRYYDEFNFAKWIDS